MCAGAIMHCRIRRVIFGCPDAKGGDAVAQVGASGGAEESGLYFELRHEGKPFDPLRWVAR